MYVDMYIRYYILYMVLNINYGIYKYKYIESNA